MIKITNINGQSLVITSSRRRIVELLFYKSDTSPKTFHFFNPWFQNKEGGEVTMSDRISNLPDSLLLHILSSKYLQTKDVIATMLLSKIWKSLWLSIPKLEFYEKGFRSYESFLQFIDSTLNLVDSKSLKMFSLKCEYFDMPHDKVDIWVNTVLKSKLEYLNLCFAPCFDIMVTYPPLPSGTFNSNTIRILKLVRVKVSNLSTVNLPSLKALHMMYVVFSDAESLGMLLSKCVRLQELLLLYLGFPDDENMKLDIGRLHHLVTAKVSSVDLFRMEVFSNVTFLSLEEHDYFPGDYEFPTFYNSTQLEIHYLTQKGWSSLVCCLRSFPKLETLIIYEGCKGLDWSMEAGPDNVPPCVSSNLKVFVLGGFNYLQSEFEIVSFIMNHAKVLSSVIIWTRDYPRQEAKRIELLGILSSYPKCCMNCRLFVNVPAINIFQNVYSKLGSDKEFSYYFHD